MAGAAADENRAAPRICWKRRRGKALDAKLAAAKLDHLAAVRRRLVAFDELVAARQAQQTGMARGRAQRSAVDSRDRLDRDELPLGAAQAVRKIANDLLVARPRHFDGWIPNPSEQRLLEARSGNPSTAPNVLHPHYEETSAFSPLALRRAAGFAASEHSGDLDGAGRCSTFETHFKGDVECGAVRHRF